MGSFMRTNFFDSEIVSEDIVSLRERWFGALSRVGSHKFFSSPEKDAKEAREAMAIYFFMAGLRNATGRDLQVRQPKSDPPDFQIITWGKTMPILEYFELVEITMRCQRFEEMMATVQKKLEHGYPRYYHLLIFVNHEKSEEWVKLLNAKLEDNTPFKMIWTVSVWSDGVDGYGSTVNRLRPHPAKSINTKLGDEKIIPFSLPSYMEGTTSGRKVSVQFTAELLKKFRKWKIDMMRSQNNLHQD